MNNQPDKLLFTPGPLTTSHTIKEAMLRDFGSRDKIFIEKVLFIRNRLLETAGVSKQAGYEAVIMQGSGTFGIESVISSALPDNGHLLIIINGVYGERIAKMAAVHHIAHTKLVFAENEIPDLASIKKELEENQAITHVAMIHCETTTGIIIPIEAVGKLCAEFSKTYIVDAMSSFGAYPIQLSDCNIDYLISSSNKCIEGVPGFAFALCKKSELEKAKGQARSLSLDLYEQWAGLEASGQFRFTPPTLSIMAFQQAMKELEEEGGVSAREARYKTNKKILDEGMHEMGFQQYLSPEIQGHIITSFLYPDSPDFKFDRFYQKLNERGFVIYPGKLSKADAFRIGNIGQIFPEDVKGLLKAIEEVMKEEGVVV